MKCIVIALFFGLVAPRVFGGDAIAIGYDYAGGWAALTYNRSSTPKGSPYYHDAMQACLFAVRDLYARAAEGVAKTKIIGQSNLTGYVTIARGRSTRNTDVTTIGRGKSQAEADDDALQKLSRADAMSNLDIVYRYFSYGEDSGKHSHSNHKAAPSSKIGKGRT